MRADARAAVLLAGTQTMLAGECGAGLRALVLTDGAPVPARGGVPPLQRLGALRGRSPRSA